MMVCGFSLPLPGLLHMVKAVDALSVRDALGSQIIPGCSELSEDAVRAVQALLQLLMPQRGAEDSECHGRVDLGPALPPSSRSSPPFLRPKQSSHLSLAFLEADSETLFWRVLTE